MMGLLGGGSALSKAATQDNKNTEGTQMEIHAPAGIRTREHLFEGVNTFHGTMISL
jgi:hypothetical protein